ncbi:MAG: alanine--tRNA ligase [Planctomycetota bacterium]
MLSSEQVRNSFIDFFKEKEHEFIPSSPIVPVDDDTLLFTNAGMNQFKNIFMGLSEPQCCRAANSQKCLRVSGKHNDLEEVGRDTYHHTFFEMLGNWSFGDYFKAEAIEWAWELVAKVWGISPEHLWVTVFAGDSKEDLPEDEEAKNLWTKVTPISVDRVLTFGKKDNFWEMGSTGPCGPCSEIHIDLGPDMCDMKNVPGHKCAVNAGCARFIELWNLVFIQYNRTENDQLQPLKAKYVDTGAGLERITLVLQKKQSNYDTDLFMPIINSISDISGHKYTSQLNHKTDNAFRVIADHIRALTFAITDGATPSNEARGYVIRRILRRASRFGRELGMHEPFIYKLVPVVVDVMGRAFSEIKQRADYVSTVIESEEVSFGRTLDRGIEIFNGAAQQASDNNGVISGDDAFQLYDTYGFPFDLTELMARERGLKVDTGKFDELMAQQRKRARAAQKSDSLVAVLADTELPATEDLHRYDMDSCQSCIVGFIDNEGFKKQIEIEAGKEMGIILDRTCFYAEAGGQVGDCGLIKSADSEFLVDDTIKIANCIVHRGKVTKGTFTVGLQVEAQVGNDREATKRNHTATHLLQWALQTVVGKSITQKGSLVCADYLRFDFTCPKALTEQQLKKVQVLVREKIYENQPVTCRVMPKSEADKLGAMALFGEKYGSEVRVVALGAQSQEEVSDAFSKEFCGGTHVERLGAIGCFKIIKEESISAGVRRITALTGRGLLNYLEQRSDIVNGLSTELKVPAEDLTDRVNQLISENKKLNKQLKSAAKQSGADFISEAKKLLDGCEKIGESSVIVTEIPAVSIEQARSAIDMLKKKAKSSAIVLGFADNDKVTLLVAVTDDLIKKNLKAGDIVRQIAPIVDGGGGGRPQMAQAGGKNPAKLSEALQKAAKLIKEKLAD